MPGYNPGGASSGNLGKDLVSAVLQKGLSKISGLAGIGTTNTSNAQASNTVNVSPNITVIGGQGSANPYSGGTATSSLSNTTDASRDPYQPYGSGRAIQQADLDQGTYDFSSLDGAGSKKADTILGLPMEVVLAGGAAVAAYLALG